MPYGMYLSGIGLGMMMNVACVLLCYISVYLYMEAKKLTSVPSKTLYEFSYTILGKQSIYVIAFFSTVQAVGYCLIYFIVFSSILSSLVSQLFLHNQQNFWSSKVLWTILLGAGLLPVVMKKTLTHMKWAGDLHLIAVMLFLIVLFIQRLIF